MATRKKIPLIPSDASIAITAGKTLTVTLDATVENTNTGDNTVATALTGTPSITVATVTTTGDIELGHASDTTIHRVSAGLVSIEGSNILTATTGAAIAQTFYIGTTQVAINRASAALTLAGITLTTPEIGSATGTSLDLGTTTLYGSRAITVDTGGVLNIVLASAAGDDFTVDTDKLVVEGDTGNVGIGTTGPYHNLDVGTAVSLGIAPGAADSSYGIVTNKIIGSTGGTNSAIYLKYVAANLMGYLGVYDYGNVIERPLKIQPDGGKTYIMGNVGIGTTTPETFSEKLKILGDRTTTGIVDVLNLQAGKDDTVSGVGIMFQQGYAAENVKAAQINTISTGYLVDYKNDLAFWTNTGANALDFSEKVRIQSTGNVGIGTTAPATKLDIAGSMQVSSAVALSLGGYVRTFAEATATLTGANTTIQVNIPTGSRILGAQLRVDTLVASADGGTSWAATYSGGATQAIGAAGQVFTKNTKVNAMFNDTTETDIVSSEVDILIDCNGAYTFSAGVIRAIVYYETFTAMGTAA